MRNRHCVVIGGGVVAERKAFMLLKAGASITLISNQITKKLASEVRKGNIVYKNRKFRKGDVANAFVVIAATSDAKVNLEAAKHAPFLVNVADCPGMSNFIVPSVINKGSLTIAVSTGGVSPAVAKMIKSEIDRLYDDAFVSHIDFLRDFRNRVITYIKDPSTRRNLLQYAASEAIITAIRSGRQKEAEESLDNLYDDALKKAEID